MKVENPNDKSRLNVKWILCQPHLLLIFNLNSAHDTRKTGESAFRVVLSQVGLDPNYIDGPHV